MSVKPEVEEVSKLISPYIIIDKDGKVDAEELKKAYPAGMPEGITMEVANAVDAYDSLFRAGVAYALGTAGNQLITANPELDKIEVKVPMAGRNAFTASLHRTISSNNPKNPALPVITHGGMRFEYDVYDASRYHGHLKAVREHIAAEALAAYGS
jgi:hypothetical protein